MPVKTHNQQTKKVAHFMWIPLSETSDLRLPPEVESRPLIRKRSQGIAVHRTMPRGTCPRIAAPANNILCILSPFGSASVASRFNDLQNRPHSRLIRLQVR